MIHTCQSALPDFTYLHKPEQRRALERDGFICVGDMGWLDA